MWGPQLCSRRHNINHALHQVRLVTRYLLIQRGSALFLLLALFSPLFHVSGVFDYLTYSPFLNRAVHRQWHSSIGFFSFRASLFPSLSFTHTLTHCHPPPSLYLYLSVFLCSGGGGMVQLPMEMKTVNSENIKEYFPPASILQKWHRGEDADWPPMDDSEDDEGDDAPMMPVLRFPVGTRVQCRISSTDWAPGTITGLWYRERTWPEGSWAPYRIVLDGGQEIFAPADMDQVVRYLP